MVIIITLHTRTRGKAIGSVCLLSVCLSSRKSLDLEIQASESSVSVSNLSEIVKNYHLSTFICLIRAMSATNFAFLSVTPINHTL